MSHAFCGCPPPDLVLLRGTFSHIEEWPNNNNNVNRQKVPSGAWRQTHITGGGEGTTFWGFGAAQTGP